MALPIYFDYAATTPLNEAVLNEMMSYFTENFGNSGSRHHAYGWLAEEAVDDAKGRIAKALKCNQKEIIFTSGATESINLCLKGFIELNPNYQIISCETEHKATLEVVADLAKKSTKTTLLEVHGEGELSLEKLEKELQNGKSLVSLMWVNNETGVVHPISEIIKLKEKYDFLLHIDATQAVGKIEIDFSGIDFMSFSAHKIYGPKGMGALLIRDSQKINAQILGGGQQQGLRSGTLNIPGIVGLGKAVEIATSRIADFNTHCRELQTTLETEIVKIFPKARVNAAKAHRVSNISNICFDGFDGDDLMRKLYRVAVSNGSACNSATTFPSHVLTAMGMSESDAFASLRFSFGWENTEKDLEVLFENLGKIVN
jgi:cysteine desulfurase